MLQRLRGTGPALVLDTTYCDPQYTFPSQAEIIKHTLNALKTELFNPRMLIVFGTYTIGKERIFLEVRRARAHQNSSAHAHTARGTLHAENPPAL